MKIAPAKKPSVIIAASVNQTVPAVALLKNRERLSLPGKRPRSLAPRLSFSEA